MGILEKAIYKMIPRLNELEGKIESVIVSGKEVVDDFKKGVDYGKSFAKNVDDYITSGKPMDYMDKAADTFANGMRKVFTDAFKDIRDDFNKKYGIYSAGGASASVPVQPAAKKPAASPTTGQAPKAVPGKGNGRTFYVDRKGNVEVKPVGYEPTKPVVEKQIKEPAVIPKPVIKPMAKPEATPVAKPVEKQLTLDSIVEDFKRKLKQLSPDIDAGVDVYAPGGLLRSYASKYNQEKAEVKASGLTSGLESRVELKADVPKEKYEADYGKSKGSARILELYNKGYGPKAIIKETAKEGYNLKSRNDVIWAVAGAIAFGAAYLREKYNHVIATTLGATEQLINDYLAGKSYAEIKENLKNNTNGMKVSDSSILRVMHNYEKKTGTKAVGKRNGKGKAKNSSAKPGNKAADPKK